MIWHDHSAKVPDGAHAVLSASKYHWLDYSDDQLTKYYVNSKAAQRGTELHALAAELIRKKIEVKGRDTFAMYVNDAIRYRMIPELKLWYSPMCFGTTDAIAYSEKKRTLRIHDLKSGNTPASMKQLHVYAGLFFLDYNIKPEQCKTILCIYQNDQISCEEPDVMTLHTTIDRIKYCSTYLSKLDSEGVYE